MPLWLFVFVVITAAANPQCALNISFLSIEENKLIGSMDFLETIEISFDLQINSVGICSQHDWCHILHIDDRLPLLMLTHSATEFTSEFLLIPSDYYSKVSDIITDFVSQMIDGEYHHFDIKYTPTQRIIAFDSVTYLNVTSNNDISQVNTRNIYAADTGTNQYVVDGNIKNLCIRTRWITSNPTSQPTQSPTQITQYPSKIPTISPTKIPSNMPTKSPSDSPTKIPSDSPTRIPSDSPTKIPSISTESPSNSPTSTPSSNPTSAPFKMLIVYMPQAESTQTPSTQWTQIESTVSMTQLQGSDNKDAWWKKYINSGNILYIVLFGVTIIICIVIICTRFIRARTKRKLCDIVEMNTNADEVCSEPQKIHPKAMMDEVEIHECEGKNVNKGNVALFETPGAQQASYGEIDDVSSVVMIANEFRVQQHEKGNNLNKNRMNNDKESGEVACSDSEEGIMCVNTTQYEDDGEMINIADDEFIVSAHGTLK